MKKKTSLLFTILVTLFIMPGIVNAQKEVVIIHTNDVHSRVNEEGDIIGYAKLKGYINELKNTKHINPLVLDAGDCLHGQVIAISEEGESIVRIMNEVGYTAVSPGNHDFNYGADRLTELRDKATFEILTANVLDKATKKTLYTPYIIREVDGIKIGIFGLCTPETAIKTNPKNVENIEFDDCIKVSKNMVNVLSNLGVDAIVCVGHIGLDVSSPITSDELCASVDGIDVFVDGHSHSVLPDGLKVNETLIVSSGQYLNNIGQVTLTFDDYNKLEGVRCELLDKEKVDDLKIQPDEDVLNLVEKITAEQESKYGEVVFHTDIRLDGERNDVRTGTTNLTNLLGKAVYEHTNADAVIINGGTIRTSIEAGDVTRLQIINVVPFNNIIVTKKITGAELKNALEEGVAYYPVENGGFPDLIGMSYKFDPLKPKGKRIVSITKDGEEIDMTKEYIVAMSDYLGKGGDGYPFGDIPVLNEYESVNEVFVKYLEKGNITSDKNDVMVEIKIVFIPIDKLTIYKVRENDNLLKIAREHNTYAYDIARINGIDLSNPVITESQLLFIPNFNLSI